MSSSIAMFPAMFLMIFSVVGLVGLILILRGGRVREPSCGACGYSVAGLEVLRCPECGADLREVGIVTPSRGSWGRAAMAVLMFTLIIPLPMGVSFGVVLSALPVVYTNAINTRLTPTPAIGGAGAVIIHWTGTGSASNVVDTAEVQIERPDGTTSAPFVIADGRYRWGANAWTDASSGARADVEAIETWLTEEGVTGSDLVATELMTLLTKRFANPGTGVTVRGPAFAGVAVSMNTTVRQYPAVRPLLTTLWGVIWLVGVILVVRRTRPTAVGV